MIVGIAEIGVDLIGCHESIQRYLIDVTRDRVSDAELSEIITNGMTILALDFSPDLIAEIRELSAGFPYFTHLLALNCARIAVLEDRTLIDISHLKEGLVRAVREAEICIRNSFTKATQVLGNPKYEQILIAAANIDKEMFSKAEICEQFKLHYDSELSETLWKSAILRFSPSAEVGILTRLKPGIYKFTDPRMVSYKRMRHAITVVENPSKRFK